MSEVKTVTCPLCCRVMTHHSGVSSNRSASGRSVQTNGWSSSAGAGTPNAQ